MRGLPGSGKSRYVRENCSPGGVVVASDHYFETPEGYRFDINRLAEVHRKCIRRFVDLLTAGTAEVWVDNINLLTADWTVYYRLAEAYGYEVEVVWVIADPKECFARQAHAVPESNFFIMLARTEPIPVGFNWRVA